MVWLVYRALRRTNCGIHFRNIRKGRFIERSKLRQNQSAIPAHLSAQGRQAQGFFGLADPAPHQGIVVETKAAFMRDTRIGQ